MADSVPLNPVLQELLVALEAACRTHYGDHLRSLAVFGSVGRGSARPDSDLDLLVVADNLPNGRVKRVQDFDAVERALDDSVTGTGTPIRPLSPVFKTPAELEAGSPLLLDMIEDARILVDRDGLLRARLDRLQARLAALGSRRVWRGNAWHWDLKPDYQPGDVFEL